MHNHPIILHLDAGEHRICHCGASHDPPLCDRSAGARCQKAAVLRLEQARTVPICTCGRSGRLPVCDGRHGYYRESR
ncbi:MAG: CDGSH iron-sulfur domain-containing protein [Magnetococcales bacterium]|nr:CDGSH iron-sulfur domain-containing protein [Magnetococcales bacterium]